MSERIEYSCTAISEGCCAHEIRASARAGRRDLSFMVINILDSNRYKCTEFLSDLSSIGNDNLFLRHISLYLWEISNFYNEIMQEKDGKYIFGVVKVGDKGQIVIPRDARKQYDIKPGDALLLLGDDSGMALVKTEIFESLIGQVMEGLTK